MAFEEKEPRAAPAWLKTAGFWRKGLLAQRENLQTLLLALLLAFLIRGYVAESRYIPSDSMVPTLYPGDRLVVEKISYQFRSPQPGEVIVFQPPEILQLAGYTANQAFIKRVIGTPGQVVQVHEGQVYVDNQPLKESYLAERPGYEWGPLTVPAHKFFVLGDNRNNSFDSHVWGFLPARSIIGRATWRFWPPGRIGFVRKFRTTDLRNLQP
ncbi:MAG TPA: signal peptidase I [Candidatus Caenarcaniphilales bacterium]